MMYGYGWGGFGIIMMLGMAIFWIGIIVLAVFLFRRMAGHQYGQHYSNYQGNYSHPSNEALEILRHRLANGDISAEEFEKMKDMLK